MAREVKELSWDPVRSFDGKTYCAPACGAGCKWGEHESLRLVGQRLLKDLPRGWEMRLHENFGWHLSLFRGPVEINHPKRPWSGYSIGMRERGILAHGDTPLEALKAMRTVLQADALKAAAQLEALYDAMLP
jgi:hypothetical protein